MHTPRQGLAATDGSRHRTGTARHRPAHQVLTPRDAHPGVAPVSVGLELGRPDVKQIEEPINAPGITEIRGVLLIKIHAGYADPAVPLLERHLQFAAPVTS
jgi:hypothetical protein